MTQRQVAHQVTLPPCAEGHTARHFHDQRAMRAGGGHFIECSCRSTGKHEGIDAVLDEWFRVNQKRRPRAARAPIMAPPIRAADVIQFALPLARARRP